MRVGLGCSLFAKNLFAMAFVSVAVANCGIVGLCTNDCGPGWVHGSADCGCMQVSKPNPTTPQPVAAANDHYIVRRYFCEDVADRSDRGSCDVTVNAKTCPEARQQINNQLSQVGDPCRVCANITDASRKWKSTSQDIQDGPCRGFAQISPSDDVAANSNEYGDLAVERPSDGEQSLPKGGFTPVPHFAHFAYLHYLRKVADIPTDNSVATCRQQCSSNSPYCLSVTLDAATVAGLKRLQQTVSTNPTRIPSQQLRAMFGLSEDRCARQDTTIVSGDMTNLGIKCDMYVRLSEATININVPSMLRGRWVRQAQTTQVVFDDPKARGSLHFSDPGLDLDWGGDIVNMYSEPNYVGFGVGTLACVRAMLN